ncbi:MAG: hypothetical protein AB8B80_14610 [Marinicellaceae bacterium]
MNNKNRRKFLKKSLFGGTVVMSPAVMSAVATPPETEGPFYPITPQKDKDFDLTQIDGKEASALGEVVTIRGRVVDTEGAVIEGATVDIWQANAAGRYNHPHDQNPAPLDPNFQGWAIVQSGKEGQFIFKTIVPGAYPVSKEWTRPPHIHFKVSKTGYDEVVTQMYFPDHELNKTDRLLLSKSPSEQSMMIAESAKENQLTYTVVMAKI